jgi:hypothetical protein
MLIAVAACTATAGILEAALRVSGMALPAHTRPDPIVGWSCVPFARYVQRAEGSSAGRFNSIGQHDVEHPVAKPAGVYRILVLGDSFSEALQVPLAATYSRQLEARLNDDSSRDEGTGPSSRGSETPRFAARSNVRVEVMLLARSGMGTAQQLRWWQAIGRAYEPDMVLLQTCINDPVDNVTNIRGRESVPYYTLRDGALVVDEMFVRERAYAVRVLISAVRRRSALVELAYQSVQRVRTGRRSAASQPPDQRMTLEAFENHYLADPPGEWRDALQLTERLLVQLRDEVHSAGARLVVFGATHGVELEPGPPPPAGLDWDRREQWWRIVCRRSRIDFVPLLDAFRRRRDESGISPHGFGRTLGQGHWNEHGHRWAAELLAAELGRLMQQPGAPQQTPAMPRLRLRVRRPTISDPIQCGTVLRSFRRGIE